MSQPAPFLSNHWHGVLHVDPERAAGWSDEEVARRWCSLFRGQALVESWQAGEALSAADSDAVETLIAQWRARLVDISWFMRCLNEGIARMANREDGSAKGGSGRGGFAARRCWMRRRC